MLLLKNHPPLVNFWKVSDLWHSLMTATLGYEKYAAGGCDIGGIVSSQLGHKYADELYGIHIGSGLPLDFFNGPRAWDFARNRPLTDDQPADIRDRIIEHGPPLGVPPRRAHARRRHPRPRAQRLTNRYPWAPAHDRTPVVQDPT